MAKTTNFKTDVLVLGAGTAGLAAYRAAKSAGAEALLVERGAYGTTCARVGCMPSKLLIAAAEVAHTAASAAPFGVRTTVTVDGREVMARVRRERDRFVGFVVDGVEAIPEADRLRGDARFVGPNQVAVGDRIIEARAVVVATGSSPAVPRMFDAVKDRLFVNDDVFSWEDIPKSVAVFGAGVVGLELGQAFHRLGARVRLLGKGGGLGPLTDPVVREAALRAFGAELAIDTDAKSPSIEPGPGRSVIVDGEPFDALLVAAGRRPNLLGLGLDAVAPFDAGRVVVDRQTLRWGDTHVFIAGDANSEFPLLHEAADEGRIAGENAAAFPRAVPGTRRSPLGIVFSDPQLAVVGERFGELTRRGAGFVAGAVDFTDQGRSRVMLQNKGAARVYVGTGHDAGSVRGRLLGAEIAGPRAEHLGHLLAWAHQQGLTVDQALAMPFYHPVIEEGLRTALRDARTQLEAR